MTPFLLIFVGAGFGGVCRFLLGTYVQKMAGQWSFPIGTFAVNMIGCLLIGILAELAETKGWIQGDTRLFVFVGLLGGFTTFSSFGYETVQLIRTGQYVYAAANAVLQVVLGLTAVWIGLVLARTAAWS